MGRLTQGQMAPWTTLTELSRALHSPWSARGEFARGGIAAGGRSLAPHATAIDGEVAPEERRKLRALLQTHFGLGDDETRRLIREAEVREHDAVDLYRFTSVLCAQLDQDGRKQIIEMLWEIAMADRVVHELKSNLVWRVAELLGVSARDRVLLRKTVASRLGLEAES